MVRSRGAPVGPPPTPPGARDPVGQPTLLERIERTGPSTGRGWRAIVLVVLVVALVLVCLASVAYGSKPIPFGTSSTPSSTTTPRSNDHLIVRIAAGAAHVVGLLRRRGARARRAP